MSAPSVLWEGWGTIESRLGASSDAFIQERSRAKRSFRRVLPVLSVIAHASSFSPSIFVSAGSSSCCAKGRGIGRGKGRERRRRREKEIEKEGEGKGGWGGERKRGGGVEGWTQEEAEKE